MDLPSEAADSTVPSWGREKYFFRVTAALYAQFNYLWISIHQTILSRRKLTFSWHILSSTSNTQIGYTKLTNPNWTRNTELLTLEESGKSKKLLLCNTVSPNSVVFHDFKYRKYKSHRFSKWLEYLQVRASLFGNKSLQQSSRTWAKFVCSQYKG